MGNVTVALFGEAEKGEFQTPYYCQTLPQLVDTLGNPPPHSQGLFFATQTILYNYDLIFFRVREEGFSHQDYFLGLRVLETQPTVKPRIAAVCLPGVGDTEILHAMTPFCLVHHSIIITTPPDLYDYLTAISGMHLP